jgi:hypothetical protein
MDLTERCRSFPELHITLPRPLLVLRDPDRQGARRA